MARTHFKHDCLLRDRILKLYSMPILIGIFFYLSSCDARRDEVLTIAVSANMQQAMEELSEAFMDSTGISCELVVASSGKLTAQILEGAPFDLFLSADMKYPEKIHEAGKAHAEPEVYAFGYLVFWSLNEDQDLTASGLLSSEVNHVAVTNPTTAPYGAAAMELLEAMGILDQLRKKLVFGESIAQTNQFILSGSAEMGITARSVVLSPAAEGQGHWLEADRDLYRPISQGLVILEGEGLRLERALAFRAFLKSPSAKEILHKFGYGINEIE